MKNYITLLIILLMLPFITNAQKDTTKVKGKFLTFFSPDEKLARPAFESASLIDNATNVLFQKNTLEVVMAHRFGVINSDAGNDLVGFWGASNIRIGVAYSVTDRIAVGFGTTKDYRLQDFNLKGAILQQTRSNKMPLSVSYYGNFTIDARSKDQFNMVQDRYSFFNQLIIARRFSPEFSAQITGSVSHFNAVENVMRNDMVAMSFGARYKVTSGTAIVVDYSQPLTKFYQKNPHPGISLGVEFGTSGHTFQIFATNYHGIVPQYNYMKNSNDLFDQHSSFFSNVLIGFNITRNYNF